MATLALSLAGQFVGGAVGGPLGATLGRALGALAGNAIDNALFADSPEVKAPSPFTLQGSSEGGVIPRIYGWNRIVGNVIWATNLERQTSENAGSKGLETAQNEEIVANFAIGLCEGEVAHIGRIWADGRLLETEGINFRFYSGSQTQIVDSLIEIKQGADNAPAYRGLCYLVFEGLPLGEFGNRIPNISVEWCRVVGDLEPAIKAITLIPGSTEFGYDPEPRVRIVSPGVTAGENTDLLGQTSDWTISLDELQGLCPNLEHVALVIAWFGDDLRCGHCKVEPRVENSTKQVTDTTWIVSGKTRDEVPLMTQFEGGPAYGGTPSDAAVLSAIADLKARGIRVTLYPFVLMDIDHTNSLPDPYTGATGQAAYPWRGRITSAPAPGEIGSPDKTVAMNSQVNAFVGTALGVNFSAATDTVNYVGPLDWGYRRMILHYAHLSVLAGGVDAFLIGSEFRGLTWLRNSLTGFPFVDALVTLAADVRTIVGASPKLTYGADWSEYSGFQPEDAPGDKLFHLDPLWASAAIDAIGIDNYMPLSDWRGNGDEPDQAQTDNVYSLAYLQGNIAGGEGFDWYYASTSDRDNAIRTPISDGPANEPWVWRYKDLQSWWSNAHHNRVGGIRSATSTGWIPQSKPIWLTELGCGAVDKGANTPNVFGDPKSVENASPYFSDGTEDTLIQRQFLRAHHQFWQPGSSTFNAGNNPSSSQYAGLMIDPERLYVWTWDARPYPAFPNRADVWSDGANHATGHWMTGRLGAMAGDEYLDAIAKDYDVSFVERDVSSPQIQGAQIANMVSLRRAIEPMLATHDMFVRDMPNGMSIRKSRKSQKHSLLAKDLCAQDLPIYSRQKHNKDEAIGQLALTYLDRSADYQSATLTVIANLNPAQAATSTNLVLNGAAARKSAQNLLRSSQDTDSLEISLPFSMQFLEVGDALTVSDKSEDALIIDAIREGNTLRISASQVQESLNASVSVDKKISASKAPHISAVPEIVGAHLPGTGGDIDGTRLLFAAFSDPWPGDIILLRDGEETPFMRLENRAVIGELLSEVSAVSSHVWDRTGRIEIQIYSGHLSSKTELEILNGANQIAIQKDDQSWEILGFSAVQIIGTGQYRLSNLLRGQSNTLRAVNETGSIGNKLVFLDSAVSYLPLGNDQLDLSFSMTAYAGTRDLVGQSKNISINPYLAPPLQPVHLLAMQNDVGNDIEITWIRRTQTQGDVWSAAEVPLDFAPEAYQVQIFDGLSLVRDVFVSTNQLIYTEAQQIADLGAALSPFTFSVRQISAVHGSGDAQTSSFSI